jgi:hypothetical protein
MLCEVCYGDDNDIKKCLFTSIDTPVIPRIGESIILWGLRGNNRRHEGLLCLLRLN